jgi:hypothetical protein
MNFLSLLTVFFIGLKLTGYITWSWFFVLIPLYAGIVLSLALGTLGLLVVYLFDKFRKDV